MDFNLIKLAKKHPKIPDKLSATAANDKHMNMLEAIREYAKPTEQKNLTPVYIAVSYTHLTMPTNREV